MRYIYTLATLTVMLISVASCDGHRDFPENGMRIGQVLLSDGNVVDLRDYDSSASEAVGVIYRVNGEADAEGDAFAVALHDLAPDCFADALGSSIGSSSDVTDFAGNRNTYSMYTSGHSPIADSLFVLWKYGQSAYLPSVGQMSALAGAKDRINPVIMALGGDTFSSDPDRSWYWTSTEVSGQEGHKAWLYSVSGCVIHETPKDEAHKARPVITVYRR